jgi:hypothetical protein
LARQFMVMKGEQAMFDLVALCALPRCTDVVGAKPTLQLSLQPEAPGRIKRRRNRHRRHQSGFLQN